MPLPTLGGTASRLINNAANGLAAVMLDAPAQQDACVTRVDLFIDQSSRVVGKPATAKDGNWD